ncbi:type VII secretion protein EccCb [Streptomyces guryensis]|uniref:Type VII secretion protein EccCb n=1 Tax=Streptomyces guryensis TaxID=2886947 RepID=A0A9Q3Z4C7_9ACTN|nr:type VII secretion protein EccCb [Streptomyces guryensis]MCD9873238.1 type VII secretion protein EccCb [Streptomyces guryensis]
MAGRRIALLVATDGYQDPGLSQLRAPARGAGELKALLQDPAIGRYDFVRELLNRPKEEIESQIEEVLSDRSPDDLVLLYFACHGIRNDADQLFFATLTTQLRRPHTTAIQASLVHQLLDECQARTKIVLLDCCYSGLFHRGRPMSPAPVDVEKALVGRGTFVITASTALEYAYDGEQVTAENGPSAPRFTSAVIEGLSTGLADRNRDGVITPDELYDFVHQAMTDQPESGQTPTKSGQCEGNVELAYAPWIDAGAGPFARAARADELTLGSILPPPVDTVDRGFICDAWEGASRLMAPVGRLETGSGGELMCVDFSSRDGNAAVVGKLGSGKTTLLRSMIMSLALTHTPHEAEFYLLEGAVNRLGVLRPLPHVQMFAAPHEHSAVEGVLNDVEAAVATRRTLFRDLDIDSIESFRTLRSSGRIERGIAGDIFLVIDGWLDFRWEHPQFEDQVHRLANTGLNYGVHLLVTARRWSDFSVDLRGLLGTRIELALDDPEESHVDPALASGISVGWALSRRRRFRVAVPRFDDGAGDVAARRSLTDTAHRISAGWLPLQEDAGAARPARLPLSFTQLLGLDDAASVDVSVLWRPRAADERLRVPLGTGEDGRPVLLDIKDAARGGMGPHGLCVGAPGSGKSELLRTLVLGLAVSHSSEQLNFVLADFKGDSTFTGMAKLPHVSAVITDLADELPLVDRMRDALGGELQRRQELLRSAGNYANIREYDTARAAGVSLEPLPTLAVVIDGFSELLTAKPDFIEVFIQIGRIGRSLGVHLLLAAQRLEEGRLRGLDTFLSYRIGLRTYSAAESRAVLGVPDAYHLPSDPGTGYLKSGTDEMIRFKAAYVSGPLPGPVDDDPHEPDGDTVLEVVVDGLASAGPPAHRIWLPPLHEPPSLETLLGGLVHDPGRGLRSSGPGGSLIVPLGLVDKPLEQRQDLFQVDFSGKGGHGLVVGGPQSGKSTLLSTLVLSFALTHTPAEVQFYCLDLGGGRLGTLTGLPHVGGIATRLAADQVRRTVAEVTGVLDEREAFFSSEGVWSMAQYRARRDLWPDQPWGDVFLVIDGWSTFRSDYEELQPVIADIATRGLGYGVHLVISATRYSEVRPALRDQLLSMVELRLGDPMDSEIDRREAASVPIGVPGRGLSPDKLHSLTALPRLDGTGGEESLSDGTAALVRQVRDAWHGPVAPPVRTLPELLLVAELPAADGAQHRGVPVGVDDTRLAPVFLAFETDPLFIGFGDHESGKSSFLRLLAHQIGQRYTPAQAQLLVVDYRRSLLSELPDEHVLEYCTAGPRLQTAVEEVAAALARRLPGQDVTPEQLRELSWWSGPDLYILVDDYDLIATSSGNNPLVPLLEYLPFARDVGLRIVIVRTVHGASRGLYEPFLTRMRELGAQGIVLSGDPSEGALLGSVKPSRRPPGRGTLVTRHSTLGVQLGFVPSKYD